MSKELKELTRFLQLGARSNVKELALKEVSGLTGTDEGVRTLIDAPELLLCLLTLLSDNETVQKNAAISLVNITSYSESIQTLLDLDLKTDRLIHKPPENIVKTCLSSVLNRNSCIADECCMILTNVTRTSDLVERTVDMFRDSNVDINGLVDVFTKINYNTKGANLDHLALVFSNLSQSERIRKEILGKNEGILQKLLPFIDYDGLSIRRRGIAGMVRNCCFETDCHKWLLSEDVDVLPYLLLPLADGTEFDEVDNDKLPVELQFLPDDKQREDNPEIRCMLLESLNQLCALKENREFIRERNAYVILRELHKWEKDSKALSACENCVDILIRTEQEIGAENLKEVDVPEDVKAKLDKLNGDVNDN